MNFLFSKANENLWLCFLNKNLSVAVSSIKETFGFVSADEKYICSCFTKQENFFCCPKQNKADFVSTVINVFM